MVRRRQPLGTIRPLGGDIAYRVTGVKSGKAGKSGKKARRRRKRRKLTKAEMYVRHKIDYLIHQEDYEPSQAVRVAYELARKRYGARGKLRRP